MTTTRKTLDISHWKNERWVQVHWTEWTTTGLIIGNEIILEGKVALANVLMLDTRMGAYGTCPMRWVKEGKDKQEWEWDKLPDEVREYRVEYLQKIEVEERARYDKELKEMAKEVLDEVKKIKEETKDAGRKPASKPAAESSDTDTTRDEAFGVGTVAAKGSTDPRPHAVKDAGIRGKAPTKSK